MYKINYRVYFEKSLITKSALLLLLYYTFGYTKKKNHISILFVKKFAGHNIIIYKHIKYDYDSR